MADDPYRVLGVSKDATDAEIKRSYRKLARQYHPDRNPDDAAAEEQFKSIQSSYEQIGTASARKEYDQQRRMEEMFSRGGNPFRGGFGGGGPSGGFDFSDILNQFMGGRGDGRFEQSSRNPRSVSQEPTQAARGPDISAGIDITLPQAISGTKVEFGHRRLRICSKCKGESYRSRRRCQQCNSKGVETRSSTITVTVPANAEHGQQLRLKKMGHEHPQGEPGDLLITIRLDAEEGRRWEGGKLVQEVPVTYSSMILGGKVRITTPLGKRVQIDIPQGTRIGDRRRLAGHGHDGGPLDVEFVLKETKTFTDEQLDAVKRLSDTGL